MGTFTMDLRSVVEKRKDEIETKIKDFVQAVGHRLIERSPVGDVTLWKIHYKGKKGKAFAGYRGGQFKANWQYGFNSMGAGSMAAIDPSGSVSRERVASGLKGTGSDGIYGVHYLYNNLPYAVALENGHSTQAPNGMVGLTIVEFSGAFK